MKILPLTILSAGIALSCTAQHMQVKRHNYTTFSTNVKSINPILEKRSTPEDKKHPEYGIVPFNACCSNCTELIDKRTVDSRYFVCPDTENKFFVQKSYFPLHYKKSADDIWRTIDFRLKPQSGEPGIYRAVDQPAPTQCDLIRKSTSFVLGKTSFEFNHDLTLYFFDEEKAYLKPEKGNYSNYTIGDEGLHVRNMWPGIDIEQTFRAGEIETDYVINKPLDLPISDGYMVIEDHFTLPEGWYIKEAGNGTKLENGYYSGDYKIGNGQGMEFVYHRPAYFDTKAIGMLGAYNLKANGNDYTLQMMVPVKWLNLPGNTYPIYVDPWVAPDSLSTNEIFGNYESTGLPYFQYAFTSHTLGSCNDTLAVPMQGGSTVMEAYTAIEYELTYSPDRGNPPLTAPFCTFSQITQQIINNNCGTSSGPFQCNPGQPPYTGTCTSDSTLVAGAHPLRINNFAPNFLGCLTPQCNADSLFFTLENQDSTCGDVCGYLCARGHMWSMIVVGYLLNDTMEATGYFNSLTTIQACPGQVLDFANQAQYGVPPYVYSWSTDGGVTFDSGSSQFQLTANNNSGYTVVCRIKDQCGDSLTAMDTVVYNVAPITVRGDTLIAPLSDSGYQWYLNDSLLPGQTSQTIIATQPGTYLVAFEDTTVGCDSLRLEIIITNLPALLESSIHVFPNPTSSGWILTVGDNLIGGTAKIYDATSRLVYQTSIRQSKTDLSPGLATGIYQLSISDRAAKLAYQQSIEKVN